MNEIQAMLKGMKIYAKVNKELLDILSDNLKYIGEKNPVKLGDIVLMNEYGCYQSSEKEVKSIPHHDIISVVKNMGFEGIIVLNHNTK